MKLAEDYCAVGVADEPETHPCVVVMLPHIKIQLPEKQARKLADDILRNANYLWPIEQENQS